MLILVAAMDRAGGIGSRGGLPWDLPGELRRFKGLTMGKMLIMGRRTFESIGRPLPGRTTIVVTRASIPGIICTPSLAGAIRVVGDGDGCVVGGARIFEEALPHCPHAAISLVRGTYDADTFFPVASFNKLGWELLSRRPDEGWDAVLARRSDNPTALFKLEAR